MRFSKYVFRTYCGYIVLFKARSDSTGFYPKLNVLCETKKILFKDIDIQKEESIHIHLEVKYPKTKEKQQMFMLFLPPLVLKYQY
ncbi:hypothetical protein [Beduini massiliensis]|uniref:hypothetical protein n=1 Tax=Beduini massiliensis TaxID=1585974 RepID=UPI00059A8A51|nr:hypothetical protein [Beduini massiliensis]